MPGFGTLSYSYTGGSGGKQVKVNTTQWATAFGTTSATYVDVTGATVTLAGLTASKTYNLICVSTATLDNTAAGPAAITALLIDGTVISETYNNQIGLTEIRGAQGLTGCKLNVTGATSYIAKLQTKTSAGTSTINLDTLQQSITLMAVEV